MRTSLSFMWTYLNKKQWLLLGYSALVLECFTPIFAVMFQKDLIDQVFINRHYESFGKLLFLYAIFFFGPKLWFTVRKVSFFHVSYYLQMNLTQSFLKKVYDLPTNVFNKVPVSKLLHNIRNDIADASDVAVNQLLSESVFVLVTIVSLSCAIITISPTLLSVVLLIASVYYLLLNQFSSKTKEYALEIRRERGKVAVSVEESVSAVRESIAFNRQDWQINRYEAQFQRYFNAALKESLYKVKILFVSEPFLYGTKLVVILIGGMHAVSNQGSLGEFVISFTLVDQLVTALGQLFQLSLTGKRLIAPVQNIKKIMGHEEQPFGKKPFKETIDSIVFDNVTFSYLKESSPVLKNVTMCFPIGKKIALVGSSGGGKSTIAQLLLRMQKPDQGEITINGTSIYEYGVQYTNKVSAVLQHPHFLPMSIIDNLTLGTAYEQNHIANICAEMQCHDFIQSLPMQYQTVIGERGTSLSGGQRQRLALSRALIKNTEILILDEATSALDTEMSYSVQESIDKLREGKTTIIIAHRLSTIQNADIIYVLENGSIAAQGTYEQLLVQRRVFETAN